MSDDVMLPLAEEWPVQPADDRGYVRESFEEFFGDRTWALKSLIGGIALCVPVFGPLLVEGYTLKWMRLTAWKMDAGLPALGDAGDVLKTGWHAWLVRLVWTLMALMPLGIAGFAMGIAATLLAGSDAAMTSAAIALIVIGIVTGVGLVVVGMMTRVAVVRSALYERTGAGLSISAVTAMIRSHRRGFFSAIGVSVLGALMVLLVETPLLVTAFQSPEPSGASVIMQSLIVLWYVPLGMAGFAAQMISMRAYGRWVREIDPATLPPYEYAPAEQTAVTWDAP